MYLTYNASLLTIAEGAIGFSAVVSSWRGFKATALEAERVRVSAKLRRAFAPEISLLQKVPGQSSGRLLSARWEIVELLAEAFPRHAKAVDEYRSYVPKSQLVAFDLARQDFFGHEGTSRLLDYSHENSRALLLDRVSAILQFTDG